MTSQRDIVDLATRINTRLHRAKVTRERRAATVAALLLARARSPELRYDRGDPGAFLAAIDRHTRADVPPALWHEPRTGPAARAWAVALGEVSELLAATDPGDADLLGSFFEGFLRYGNTVRDIGIVLTPAHVCRMVVELLDVSAADTVYDPAMGTGGFLVAACRRVERLHGAAEADRFVAERVYGCEENAAAACLAFAGLSLMGHTRHRLHHGSCFASPAPPAVTRVLMNPPFALKHDDEAEVRFVDHALGRMAPGGLLFAILPSSVMYAEDTRAWRNGLLARHQLRAVLLLPGDLFYPVAVESVGIVVRSGTPQGTDPVLWVRLDDDGYTKSKGARVERSGEAVRDRLAPSIEVGRRWCVEGRASDDVPGVSELRPLHGDELIPQAHLGTPRLDGAAFDRELRELLHAHLASRWAQPCP